MCGRLLCLVVVLGGLGSAAARADIVYTFATGTAAPSVGPVSGSFVVADAAIADGMLAANEIASFTFTLPLAVLPFAPTTFASPGPLSIASDLAGGIAVDPRTGRFLSSASINLFDIATSQRLALTAGPDGDPTAPSGYDVGLGEGFEARGTGRWTVEASVPSVPEPGASWLMLPGFALVAWHAARRPRRATR